MDNSNLNHTKFLISFFSLQKFLFHRHHVVIQRSNFKKDLPTSSGLSFEVNLDSDRMQSIIFWYKLLWLLLLPGSFLSWWVLLITNLPKVIQYSILHGIQVNLTLKCFKHGSFQYYMNYSFGPVWEYFKFFSPFL